MRSVGGSKERDWVVTIPKTVGWSEYQKELAAVADGTSVLNYGTRYFPGPMRVGDRCFIVHDGQVRGWMRIVGLVDAPNPWQCTITKKWWPAGKYIQRSGEFHPVSGVEMTGFRGIRVYEGAS